MGATKELQLTAASTQQILSHPTWDIILFFTLIAVGFFYGISSGKQKIASTLLYTYIALAVFSSFPLEKINNVLAIKDGFVLKTAVFTVIWIILIFFLGSEHRKNTASASVWWQVFILSFIQAGFLIHIVLNFLPPDKIKLLAPLTKNFFANPNYHFGWLIVPIIIIIIFRLTEKRR